MTEILLFLTGLVVGAMNAVAGGGMLVGFPIMVALGIPPLAANATANIVTGPGQIASAWGYRQYLKRVPWRFAILIIPLVIGAVAGSLTLRHTSADHFADIVPLLVFLGVALFAFQPLIHLHLKHHLHGRHKTIKPLFIIAIAMLPLAFYGGYFGAGFGFMMLAFLSFAHLPDAHMINAMKNVGATFVSLASLAVLHSSGLVQWRLGLVMALGSVVGGYAAARYSQKISSHWLRVATITIGVGAVVYLSLQRY